MVNFALPERPLPLRRAIAYFKAMSDTRLLSRALVRLSPAAGEDAIGFLQGLVTQDVTGTLPVWTGLLSPQGKALFDFLVWPSADDVLLDCAAEAADALVKRLSMYRLRRQIVIAGIEAHVCVMQTVLELLASGHEVHLCWEAVSGRGEEYRRHALDRMAAAGATLTNHESVAFEWARDKNHPQFKALSALLKEGQPQG